MSPTSIVAYLILFASAGFLFVLAALFLGRLLRPRAPVPEKLETYECGEPTVGTSFVQFDLRFYVVALVFIIFDVEVAFFFPWAAVFGKATQLMAPSTARVVESAPPGQSPGIAVSASVSERLRQLGVRQPRLPNPRASAASNSQAIAASARKLALAAMADMAVFFAVLMVGFAYVWSRGDLDWVRAVPQRAAGEASHTEALATAASGK